MNTIELLEEQVKELQAKVAHLEEILNIQYDTVRYGIMGLGEQTGKTVYLCKKDHYHETVSEALECNLLKKEISK